MKFVVFLSSFEGERLYESEFHYCFAIPRPGEEIVLKNPDTGNQNRWKCDRIQYEEINGNSVMFILLIPSTWEPPFVSDKVRDEVGEIMFDLQNAEMAQDADLIQMPDLMA